MKTVERRFDRYGAVFNVTTGQVLRLHVPRGISSYNIRFEAWMSKSSCRSGSR